MVMDSFGRLHEKLSAQALKDEFSGVVLITQAGRRVFEHAYGYANRAWKIENRMDTRFDTASVTKLFTAMAIFGLIERDMLSFDTRITEFLDLRDTNISPEVTVYHLLTHSSGIGDDCEEEDGDIYEELWKTKPNYMVTRTADFLPQFVHKPSNFKPGEGCRYCNCSFILLGLAIEKISGLTYREYVRRNIFSRIGMKHTDFLRLDGVHENMAEGYAPEKNKNGEVIGWRRNFYSYPPIGSPDSGAYTTAGDMDLFLRAIQAGKVLSPEMTREFLSPQVFYRQDNDYELRYGYVFRFLLDKNSKIVNYQKSGVNTGVCAWVGHYPEQDINIITFANYDDCLWDRLDDIRSAALSSQ
jgi:CubicO group peptidase (beta-lactamase class C family)